MGVDDVGVSLLVAHGLDGVLYLLLDGCVELFLLLLDLLLCHGNEVLNPGFEVLDLLLAIEL